MSKQSPVSGLDRLFTTVELRDFAWKRFDDGFANVHRLALTFIRKP
jgi:hypothetical protein